MSIKEETKEQIAQIKKLPFKKRFQNFWYYYKIHVLIGVVILFAIGLLVKHYVFDRPLPLGFSAYAINSEYYMKEDTALIDELMAEFAKREGIDTSVYEVSMYTNTALDPTASDNFNMAIDMGLIVNGEHEKMDVFIGPASIIDHYVVNGFYTKPIDTILPDDLVEKFTKEDRFYVINNEDAQGLVAGIYIGDAPRIVASGLYTKSEDEDDKDDETLTSDAEMQSSETAANPMVTDAEEAKNQPILSIVSFSPRTEVAIDFIRFIFEEPESTQ